MKLMPTKRDRHDDAFRKQSLRECNALSVYANDSSNYQVDVDFDGKIAGNLIAPRIDSRRTANINLISGNLEFPKFCTGAEMSDD